MYNYISSYWYGEDEAAKDEPNKSEQKPSEMNP